MLDYLDLQRHTGITFKCRETGVLCGLLMHCIILFFQHLTFTREFDSDSLRHYSWAADTLDNVNLVSSPVHSG